MEITSLPAFKTVGSIVQYGQYPQDADGTKRPIEWIVLDYNAAKNQALLLSRYGLEAKAFHHEETYPTWEKSDIRAWLNGEFLNNAFSAEERKRIAETVIHTEDNCEWENSCNSNGKVSGGNDCRDRIFLLSLEEAMAYVGHAISVGFPWESSEKLKTTATDYANEHRAYKVGSGCCWWWLRSPGSHRVSASIVDRSGALNYYYVDYEDHMARPALILDLNPLVVALPTEKAAADLPELGEAYLTALKTVGSIVTYGQYPQDADGTKRPIEWIVLDYNAAKNQALLLSRYGLEAKAFHHEEPYPTWEKSDIRAWLNGEFLNNAFSAEERKRIAETVIHTEDNLEWESYCKKNCWIYKKVSGGNDCRDRIFLLSLEEAMAYDGHTTLVDSIRNGSEKMKTTATDYANEHGADEDRNGCCWWWLRSPGISSFNASRVYYDGSLLSSDVYYANGVARPAFILNLGSL